MAALLKTKRRTRKTAITFLEKLFEEKVEPLYENFEKKHLNFLISSIENVEQKLLKLSSLTEEIGDLIENDDEFEKDTQSFLETEVILKEKLTTLKSFTSKKSKEIENIEKEKVVERVNFPSNHQTVRLPTFELKKFSGENPIEWQPFYESFIEAIGKNDNLADIEKLNYLFTILTGEAERTVKGLQLTNDNYKEALDILKSRYGDPQLIITYHMNNLLNIENVNSLSDLKKLRHLHDEIETQVRSLNNIELKAENYGPMLIPVLMTKLPQDLKIIISRDFGKNVWDIEKVLKIIRRELEAREKISLSVEKHDDFYENPPYSGSNLFVDGKKHDKKHEKKDYKKTQKPSYSCIFCRRNDHRSADCDIVTQPEKRKDILFKEKKCFICMKSNHIAKQCRSDFKCFKCGGRHHIAVCTFDSRNSGDGSIDGATNLSISYSNNIFLETARATVILQIYVYC